MATVNLYSSAAFGAAKTGLASSVRYTVIDSAGTTQIAATNSGIAEETDAAAAATTGIYSAVIAINPTWLPCKVKWTIVSQAGVAAVDVIGNDPAMQPSFAVASVANSVAVDGGTVSASPPPTTTTFTATGNLHAPTGGYPTSPQYVLFVAGTNQGQRVAISAHTVSGGNHAFTVAALPNAPTTGDTFVVL